MRIKIVDRRDIGVVNAGEKESFLAKTLATRILYRCVRLKNLYRDFSVQALIEGAIDNTHSASPYEATDSIVPQKEAGKIR